VEHAREPDPARPRAKRVLVVLAGAFDPPGERTPLCDAETPALDRMARIGRCGVVDTGSRAPWDGFAALLGLAGGAAPSLGACEALGEGFAVRQGESVYRADFVTFGDAGLSDPFGGKIKDPEAAALLEAVAAAVPGARVRRLGGHRNVVALPGAPEICPSPWEMFGRKSAAGLPADGPARAFFEASAEALAAHDVNEVRIDLRENPANALWLFGGGPAAETRPGGGAPAGGAILVGRGAATAGLARVLGWESSVVSGDDDVLAAAALAAVAAADLVVVRTESVLDAAAVGGAEGKRDALSRADARLVAPLLSAVEEREAFVAAAAADAVFDSTTRVVSRGAAPFVVVGAGAGAGDAAFTEQACAAGGFHVGSGAEFAALFA
jgi:2,3-bisphosphoglycerate-independent phosphoglycerate mutase